MPTAKKRRLKNLQKQKRKAKRKPVVTGITASRGEDAFNELEKIVKDGFVGRPYPSVNAYITGKLSKGGITPYSAESNLPKTKGDKYALGVMTQVKRDFITARGPTMPGEEVHIGFAHPAQIKVISIKINPLISETEEAKRRRFYKEKFQKQKIQFV